MTAGETTISNPRVCIAGARENVDTSSVVLGLLVALKRMGTSTAVATMGPSLLEPIQYRRVSGRLSVSLDPWLLDRAQLTNSFARGVSGADFLLMEAYRGLFDSNNDDCCFSHTAALARGLSAPVILVVDAEGFEESFAALVKGFADYDKAYPIAGVIALHVADQEHSKRLSRAVHEMSGCKYFGGIIGEQLQEAQRGERRGTQHSGVMTRNQLVSLGSLITEAIDVSAVRQLGATAQPLKVPTEELGIGSRVCRIAVADDAAFHATYHDNLELLRCSGAELVAFSPLADIKLPPRCKGLYLPGGYLHQYAADLQSNRGLRRQIREFAEAGGALYAEGAATPYLCADYEMRGGAVFEMLGILPGRARAASVAREIPLTYCSVECEKGSVVTDAGYSYRGVRDTRWELNIPAEVPRCATVRDRGATESIADGYAPLPHVYASTVTAHWSSNPEIAKFFVDAANAVDKVR